MFSFTYESLVRKVNLLHGEAPFLNVQVIGRSLCGRGLFALRLGNPCGGALIVAGLRGGEGAAGAALLQWAQTVCRCVKTSLPLCGVDLARVLSQTGITLLPCLNPDGLEIFTRGAKGAGSLRPFVQSITQSGVLWQANAAGVRLDRQFPCGFEEIAQQQKANGDDRPAPDGFCGNAPLSEPETRALAAFCRSERFSRALVLETGEDLLSVFPAQTGTQTRNTVLTTKMLAACAGVPFLLPTAMEQSGAFPAWFAETTGQNAFALSLSSDGDAFYHRIEEALVLYAVL